MDLMADRVTTNDKDRVVVQEGRPANRGIAGPGPTVFIAMRVPADDLWGAAFSIRLGFWQIHALR